MKDEKPTSCISFGAHRTNRVLRTYLRYDTLSRQLPYYYSSHSTVVRPGSIPYSFFRGRESAVLGGLARRIEFSSSSFSFSPIISLFS